MIVLTSPGEVINGRGVGSKSLVLLFVVGVSKFGWLNVP